MSLRFRFFLMVLWLLPLAHVMADELRPALLLINESEPGLYTTTWKTRLNKGQRATLQPRLPSALEQIGPVKMRQMSQAVIELSHWRGETGALAGATI